MAYYITPYSPADEEALFRLLFSEGDAWAEYHSVAGREKYRRALSGSLAYVLYVGTFLCGYARLRDDDGFGLYVYDLLVHKDFRGKGYGRLLLEQAGREYPGCPVYVMSDVDGYYEKLGYERQGTIFAVPSPRKL